MINWLKKNWFLFVVLIVVFSYFKKTIFINNGGFKLPISSRNSYDSINMAPQADYTEETAIGFNSILPNKSAPSSSPDRIIIQDTSLSLHVKDVSQTIKDIDQETKQLGGFLVSSHLSKPQLAASGNITIRIPTDKLSLAMESFKSMAIKVVSESITGRDVTDQYEDLGARLDILNKTKIKFEAIMDQAVSVPDLLSVQRELVNLQSQIDNIKGRQDYLQKSADLSKIVVYLSTDDLSLPYAPTDTWRPVVVIKTAVRSLLTTLRGIADLVIWLGIYSPLIVVGILTYVLIAKKRRQR